MKVDFTYKGGRVRAMRKRDAELLQRLGKGTYLTRDMVASPRDLAFPGTSDMRTVHELDAQIKADNVEVAKDDAAIDALDVDALRALAKARGLKIHHKAGADKVREALRQAV